jgi:SOS response regulatory protein OraA/RecX
MKPTPREIQESYQTYEKVVEHLIAEGYADDQQSADEIIRGMSQTWFNTILFD